MRYLIYGAGAVGGVIGAKLFLAGHEVVLIARGEHLRAIQARGLQLRIPGETLTLSIPAVERPASITFGADDVAVLTMKSQDTEAALTELRLAAGDQIPIVCCQNGVENERIALRRFVHVYGMLVIVPAAHMEPGVVETDSWPKVGILDIGRYPRGTDALAADIASDLDAAGFASRSDASIMRWKYGKLHQNMMNAVQAVCGTEADAKDLMALVRDEAEACFAAAGIDWASPQEMSERGGAYRNSGGTTQRSPGWHGGSTWQGLARGAGSSEVDHLNGEIVLLGRLHGVPTPANEVFQLYAERLARELRPPGSFSAEEMRRQVARREAELAALRPA